MSVPHLSLLDLIAARIADPEQLESQSYWAMATVIGPSLAITPLHALPSTRGSPDRQMVELHFPGWIADQTLSSDVNIPSISARVVGRDSQLDLALLQLERPVTESAQIVLGGWPEPGTEWETRCMVPSAPLGARAYGRVEQIMTLEGQSNLLLSVETGPDDPRGASGAPVICNDGLVGIVARMISGEAHWLAIPITTLTTSTFADLVRSAVPTLPAAPTAVSSPTVKGAPVEHETAEPGFDQAVFFERLSSSSRIALSRADGMRRAQGQDAIHMEHLVAALFEKENGPTQRLFARAGITAATLASVLQDAAGEAPPAAGSYASSELSAIPPHSAHVSRAFLAASEVASQTNAAQVQSRHLLYGALSVPECSLIQVLHQHGVRREDIDINPDLSNRLERPNFRSDDPNGDDLLNITKEVEALCRLIAAKDTQPPLSIGLFGDWGSGKSFFMNKMVNTVDEFKKKAQANPRNTIFCNNIVQLTFNAWHYIDKNLWASLTSEIFEGLAQALAQADNREADQARARLLAATASSKDVLAEAERQKQLAETQLHQSEQRRERIAQNQQKTAQRLNPTALLKEALHATMQQPDVAQQLDEAAKTLGIPEAQAATNEVKAQLIELQGLSGRINALALSLRNTRERWVIGLAVMLVVAVPFAINWLLAQPFAADISAAVRWLASSLGAIVGGLVPFMVMAQRAVSRIEQVRHAHQQDIDRAQQAQEAALQAEQLQLQQQLTDAEQRVDEAKAVVQRLEQQLDDLRADRQLSKYILERSASTDYTKHLGIIARAHNDFEQLSTLMMQVRAEAEQAAAQNNGSSNGSLMLPRIDRIILYIDDLDRCPEHYVVDVLQAVHLLLAFPLFVVVVGVDSRWLLHSLQQHSKAFQQTTRHDHGVSDEERIHWQSTPLNYLEKIFQIPFTLRPMGSNGFGQLIDNLTTQPAQPRRAPAPSHAAVNQELNMAEEASAKPTATTTSSDHLRHSDAEQSVAVTTVQADQAAQVHVTSPQTQPETANGHPPVEDDPEHIRIEDWERNYIKQLFPLIPSPRAAKRFVNVYQLLRAGVTGDRREEFIGDTTHGQHRAVLLLLAILTGYPAEATEILRDLLEEQPKGSWWSFIDTYKQRGEIPPAENNHPSEQSVSEAEAENGHASEQSVLVAQAERWRQLLATLTELRGLIPARQSCADFVEWAPQVARYSFHSGRVLLNQRGG